MEDKFVSSSIQREYRRLIWAPFCKAAEDDGLIRPGDRIAVCYSGGKDSSLLACCMRDYQRYSGVAFDFVTVMLDPGYEGQIRETALKNADRLGFQPVIEQADIFLAIDSVKKSCCHICASMRRGFLYESAKKLGCNKIALGHHLDDVVETTLMSILYGGQFRGMMPRVPSDSHPGMELIRPLYLIREKDIRSWADKIGLQPVVCACRMTRREEPGARQKTKALIRSLEEETPNVVGNLFASLQNVSLDTVLRYRMDQHSPWVDRLHLTGDSDIMQSEIGGRQDESDSCGKS